MIMNGQLWSNLYFYVIVLLKWLKYIKLYKKDTDYNIDESKRRLNLDINGIKK